MNDDQLATDIRRTFGRYHLKPRPIERLAMATAPTVAPDSASGLAHRRLFGGLSVAGLASAVVLAFALTFGLAPSPNRPESIWAAWQPTPAKPDSRLMADASAACPAMSSWSSGLAIPLTSLHIDDLPILVADQRGSVALFVYGTHEAIADCLVWRSPTGPVFLAGSEGSMASGPLHGAVELAGDTTWDLPVGSSSTERTQVFELFGRTDASRVVITRSDGVEVEATVSDGIFVAWWPGCAPVAAIAGYDGAGTQIARITPAPQAAPAYCQAQPDEARP
jgi:hypothetical protein